jgi:hypothetical protein
MNQITAEVQGHFMTDFKLYSLHLALVTFRCPSSLHRIIYLSTVSYLFHVIKVAVLHTEHIKTHQSKNTIPVINLRSIFCSVIKNVRI